MANKHGYFSIIFMAAVFLLTGSDSTWNAPHPQADAGKKIIYYSFAERPKHLDPARSYSTDESRFIDQVYDAPLSYHYLQRPYALQPNTLTEMPRIVFTAKDGNQVPEDSEELAYRTYYFTINPGIQFQPQPRIAKSDKGEPYYRFHSAKEARAFNDIADFEHVDTKELVAEDYLYEVRRLADPKILSPIRGLLSEYIDGMSEF